MTSPRFARTGAVGSACPEPVVNDGLFPGTQRYPPPIVDHGAARQRAIGASKTLAAD